MYLLRSSFNASLSPTQCQLNWFSVWCLWVKLVAKDRGGQRSPPITTLIMCLCLLPTAWLYTLNRTSPSFFKMQRQGTHGLSLHHKMLCSNDLNEALLHSQYPLSNCVPHLFLSRLLWIYREHSSVSTWVLKQQEICLTLHQARWIVTFVIKPVGKTLASVWSAVLHWLAGGSLGQAGVKLNFGSDWREGGAWLQRQRRASDSP